MPRNRPRSGRALTKGKAGKPSRKHYSFDFKVDPVPPFFDPDFSEETTETALKWFDGKHFKNRIMFEKWDEISSLAEKLQTDVDAYGSDQMEAAAESLKEYRGVLASDPKKSRVHVIANETELRDTMSPLVSGVMKILHNLSPSDRKVRFSGGWRLHSETYEDEHTLPRTERAGQQITLAEDPTPAYVLLSGNDRRGMKDRFPLAAMDVKGPYARLAPYGMEEADVSDIVTWLQNVFNEIDETDTLPIARKYAQVITQAFHTRSGCAALYNQIYGIVLQVAGMYGQKIVVRVSRPFRSNEGTSNVKVLVAMLKFGLGLEDRNRDSWCLTKKLFDCAVAISKPPRESGAGPSTGGVTL